MDAVSEIKSRLSIEDVVGEYVQLKRAGSNYKGLSPFNSEKTPSFMVSPEKGIWHDFSSGKGGDIFSFIMETEGLDFKEALELLARKANIDLEQFREKGSGRQSINKNRLYEANEAACKFYQVQFSKNKLALEYVFGQRKFTKQIALDFRLGYSPNNGSALIDYLKKQGFQDKEITLAGLTAKAYRGGVQDMFRGRLMIPLSDQQGRVIGFTARQLDSNPNAPKYINTPQTALYDKSRHIYGLHLAKDALRKEGFAVLVEGNLDVIASHQAGVLNAVATAGTALTEQHLKGISRFTGDIRLAFDQDKAGQNATERAIPIASKVGVQLSIITIPDGKDPDELVKKDPKLWQAAVKKSDYIVDWVINRYLGIMDISLAPEKRRFSDTVLNIVKLLDDSVERDHYVTKLAKILEVSEDALRLKLVEPNKVVKLKAAKKQVNPESDKQKANIRKNQNQFLSILLMRPSIRLLLNDVMEDALYGNEPKKLLKYLKENPDIEGKSVVESKLKYISDYSKILSLQYEDMYQDYDDTELTGEAKRLYTRLIDQYIKIKKSQISLELKGSNEVDTIKLLNQAKALDEILGSSTLSSH